MPSSLQTASPPGPPRFCWPVRIVIFLVLFDMFFRSTDVLYPWEDWLGELKIERMPLPLPSRDELAELCQKADGSYEPAIKEFKKSFASLPGYWNPLPKEETLERLQAIQIRWAGARLNPLSDKQRQDHKLPEGTGLLVMSVTLDPKSEKEELNVGDIIVKIGDDPAPNALTALAAALEVRPSADSPVRLQVIREDTEGLITVEVSATSGAPWSSSWDNALLWLKYSLAFTASRLQWCECILNIDQEWPMFSPNVSRRKYAARARLLYEDGTEVTIRQRSDPEDLTSYFRWGPGKYMGYDRGVDEDSVIRRYACVGWCNYLSHQYQLNENGSRLRLIHLYQVRYDFPPPDKDAREFLMEVMEKTRDHRTISDKVFTTFFTYWPATKEYRFLRARQTRYAEPE